MSEAPLSISTPKEISETISIEQNNTKYSLHITSIGETLTFLITFSEDLKNKVFVRKLALKEIKDSESHQIFMPYSCKEFIDYLKTLSEMKKITLTIKEKIVFINLTVEFILKKHLIEIELFPDDNNFEAIGGFFKSKSNIPFLTLSLVKVFIFPILFILTEQYCPL